jgi:hypothetical protein
MLYRRLNFPRKAAVYGRRLAVSSHPAADQVQGGRQEVIHVVPEQQEYFQLRTFVNRCETS